MASVARGSAIHTPQALWIGVVPLGVLQGIDLEVGRGDFIALVGPSGGGKTTFLNMITGVDRPTCRK